MQTGTRRWAWAALLAAPLAIGSFPRAAAAGCGCEHEKDDDGAQVRTTASSRVTNVRANVRRGDAIEVKLLGINDFHGQMSAGRLVAGRPVGSAAVLASYLLTAAEGFDDRVVLVHAGDHVGASPASSALLQDEPAITFLNLVNEKLCDRAERNWRQCGGWGRRDREDDDDHHGYGFFNWFSSRRDRGDWCVLGTLGNHEFDEGRGELMRLLFGGNHATGPFLEKCWRGADFPYVNSNVIDAKTRKPILAPYAVRKLGGVKIGFVGAVTRTTPTIVTPAGVAGLEFVDEADAINASVERLKWQGVETIVVVIHEGGFQTSFTGPTSAAPGVVTGTIPAIVSRLDDEVDVVVSGHTHAFTNTIMENQHGVPILVTQSFSAGTAFSDIVLTIDRSTRDVAASTASIVTTWADIGPGLAPDADVAAVTKAAEAKVAPLVSQVIGEAQTAMARAQNSAGEQVLGNFIADAQRAAMGTEFCFMNPGGVRADLDAGQVTWGELFTIQPFGNSMVKMGLTGAQIDALLEQQWQVLPAGRVLSPSGITYAWDASLAVGGRVSDIRKNGVLLDPAATYSVACNSFLSTGGDGFTVFNLGTNKVGGPVDLDALIAYIKSLTQPFAAPALGRISRLN